MIDSLIAQIFGPSTVMKFILMTTWLILDRVFVALELDPGTVSRVLEWNRFKFIERYLRPYVLFFFFFN